MNDIICTYLLSCARTSATTMLTQRQPSVTSTDFSSLPLSAEFLANLQSLDYTSMTPIQAHSLPPMLKGLDIQAQAKTGSGKTAAFGIALLNRIEPKSFRTQALVLCPTRELADQVSKELRRLARPVANTKILTLCGGTPIGPQYGSLERTPHIVVGTPGRILKHLQKGSLKLNSLKTLVLDEGDRMLDMGFHEDIMLIIDNTPTHRQTLLFSATLAHEIKAISAVVQKNPVDIQVESVHSEKHIRQIFYEIQKGERLQGLVALLQHYQPESCVVFCNRKQQCQEVADQLSGQGLHALALHGDLEQKERDEVLVRFSNKSSSILIATDVAARGLDIKELSAVINYELSPDPEVHIHRIGRTGRAGHEGLALSLFTPSEVKKVSAIENAQQRPVQIDQPASLKQDNHFELTPPMVTLCINGGRKGKVRAGDILGALTSNTGLQGNQIGKIDLFDHLSYVAIERKVAKQALSILSQGKIKGRMFRVRRL
jgi:ATP-independent RNA helicase DbpA